MGLVQEIVADWQQERPDIDCSGKAVICQMLSLHRAYMTLLEKALKPLSMKPSIFSVLVTLRRKGKDVELSVKDIIQEVLVTSGGMTNLLNRLAKQALISKRKGSEPEDTRSVFIKLTPKGLKLIDKAMEIQAACEVHLTKTLTKVEKKQVLALLQKIQPKAFNDVDF